MADNTLSLSWERGTIPTRGVTTTAEAFFEIKTYTACKTRYSHNNNDLNKPPDRRAKEVNSIYRSKFKKLDKKFAADIVGDGTGDIVGPFEAAQAWFYRGQVIPLCAGWFGEINEDFEKVIKLLAQKSSSRRRRNGHISACQFGQEGRNIHNNAQSVQKSDRLCNHQGVGATQTETPPLRLSNSSRSDKRLQSQPQWKLVEAFTTRQIIMVRSTDIRRIFDIWTNPEWALFQCPLNDIVVTTRPFTQQTHSIS